MRVRCVDKKSPVGRAVPKSTKGRRARLKRFGKRAFLIPGGTPASPGVPSYPVLDGRGCFHCRMGRAAYTRIGQALARDEPESYKRKLRAARRRLIKTALRFSDPQDGSNACNWSIAASKRFKKMGGDRRQLN